ncbi:MAG: glycosyltransferase [Myxococcales bacterium]|nr:glycosyltransferase [Myxococcales bacterium]
MSAEHESGRRTGAFYDADTRRKAGGLSDDDLVLLGTVTEDAAAVRQRDRLEKAHLDRVLTLSPKTRVLDLGGGAGRIALWLAPRVAEVVLVDASAELLRVAREAAAARGLRNVTTVHASVLDAPPAGRFDVVIAFGVAAYLTDDEVDAFVDRVAEAVAAGGTVVLKEPVSTDDQERSDRRHDDDGALIYDLRFRPRAFYAERFARRFTPTYQRATLAHFFPWFVGGTQAVAAGARRPWAGAALDRLGPLLVKLDPLLLSAEEVFRADPTMARLLAPVETAQELYLFRAPPAATDETPALSVVMIAFNEEECLVPVVEELQRALDAAGVGHELVLVDDGSTDATPGQMDALAARDGRIRAVHQPNGGIGAALRTGFNAARGDFVTWVPADGQIGPEVVLELFGRRGEADMLTTIYRTRADAWYRTVISRSLNAMIKLKTGEVAKSGGNYLFARRAWLDYGPQGDDSMMISTAFRQNLRNAGRPPVEVEIDCRPRQAGRSKVLNARTIGRTAAQLLRMGR